MFFEPVVPGEDWVEFGRLRCVKRFSRPAAPESSRRPSAGDDLGEVSADVLGDSSVSIHSSA